MQIIVQRQGQDYGPYPAQAALQHLAQGTLLPNDLARDAASPGTPLQPLGKLLAASGVAKPGRAGVGAVVRQTGRDLRSLGLELVFPTGNSLPATPSANRACCCSPLSACCPPWR